MATPPRNLIVTLRPWGRGLNLFRVHPDHLQPTEFNPTSKGNARFSPLIGVDGQVIPTLYAGSTIDCALMETVFHDVPFVSGPKLHSKAKHVKGKAVSTFRVTSDLNLVDLTSIALRKLGVPPEELTRSDEASYSGTRAWAVAIHQQQAGAQGLLWTSRQDDTASAVVLFGDRVNASLLLAADDTLPLLLPDGAPIAEVQALAARLDVLLI